MKTVVVTGASRGIGHATAKKFLAEGWFVVGTATDGVIDLTDDAFVAVSLDYEDSASIPEAVAAIAALGKKIDVLVNNAGIGLEESGNGVDIDVLRQTLEVNVIGTIDFTNRLMSLVRDGGHIINISSNSGALTDFELGRWMVPGYKITKAALNMYTRVLAALLEDRSITVSAIDPGWVRTDMGGEDGLREPEEPAEEIYTLATSSVETGQFWRRGEQRSW